MTGPGGMDINKMMKQVQQMQADMARVQEELANETVEASAGGGMVSVTATGSGEIKAITIERDDPTVPVAGAVGDARRGRTQAANDFERHLRACDHAISSCFAN